LQERGLHSLIIMAGSAEMGIMVDMDIMVGTHIMVADMGMEDTAGMDTVDQSSWLLGQSLFLHDQSWSSNPIQFTVVVTVPGVVTAGMVQATRPTGLVPNTEQRSATRPQALACI